MNIYRRQFIAECPSDGQRILYALELQADQGMVMVEALNDCLDAITVGYQEELAQQIHSEFPACHLTLNAHHQGVEIITRLSAKESP